MNAGTQQMAQLSQPWDPARWDKEQQVTWEVYPTPRRPHTAWDTAWLCATLGTTVASTAQPEAPPLEQDKRWLNCIPESGPRSQTATKSCVTLDKCASLSGPPFT